MSNSFERRTLRKQAALNETGIVYNNHPSMATLSEDCHFNMQASSGKISDAISIISSKSEEASPKVIFKKGGKYQNARTLSDVTMNLTKFSGKQSLETMSMLDDCVQKTPSKKNMSIMNKLRALTKIKSFSHGKDQTAGPEDPQATDGQDLGLVCLIEDSPLRILKEFLDLRMSLDICQEMKCITINSTLNARPGMGRLFESMVIINLTEELNQELY